MVDIQEQIGKGEPFFPKDPRYTSQQLGNKQTLTPGDEGAAIRILSPNINELEAERRYEAGSWVLTCRTEVAEEAALVAVLNPLIARVSFGDGSAFTPVEIDVSNGASLQFPCGALQVDLILAPEGIPANTKTPDSQEVTATLHRSFSSAKATRSFLLSNQTGAPASFEGRIPSAVAGVRGYGLPLAGPGGSLQLLTTSGTGGIVLVTYNAAQMAAASAGGFYLGVPALATQWIATLASVLQPLASLEFLISL